MIILKFKIIVALCDNNNDFITDRNDISFDI